MTTSGITANPEVSKDLVNLKPQSILNGRRRMSVLMAPWCHATPRSTIGLPFGATHRVAAAPRRGARGGTTACIAVVHNNATLAEYKFICAPDIDFVGTFHSCGGNPANDLSAAVG